MLNYCCITFNVYYYSGLVYNLSHVYYIIKIEWSTVSEYCGLNHLSTTVV